MKLRVLAPFAVFLLAACGGTADNSPEAICRATIRCTQDKGLAVPGGVEPVRPSNNGGSLY